MGCRAIGSVGSDEKVRVLRDELSFDTAFNYKETPPEQALRQAAPDGIDIYFDNVGGEILDAALANLRRGARPQRRHRVPLTRSCRRSPP